ncbi:MAG: M50 family metallopeptidase [Parcubacteria group bacterium]
MVLTVILAFFSLIGLIILHELGHFIAAKHFGVKVEEFGIGYPPRIIGKKIGQTIYSLNLLPFGAFVKMPGEIEHLEDSASFFKKPVWQRMIIVLAGVISFWIIAAVLFSIVMGLGAPTAISDDEISGIINPKVQILAVAKDSPAEQADLRAGDNITEIKSPGYDAQKIDKVEDLQNFTKANLGQELTVTIERGRDDFKVSLLARPNPPSGEGPLGIALVGVATKIYPWWQAPWQGILATVNMTERIIRGYAGAIVNVIKGVPSGVEMTGPVGIVSMFSQVSRLGVNYFLQFVGMVAVYIAIFNILPIPSVDGGKFLFLVIEAIRRKPVSQKVEQNVTTFFFGLLILLMIFVTVKDVIKLF